MKLDPKNTELLTQKQKLLQQSIQQTQERLKNLKKASEEAAKTAENYEKWKVAYTPIQNEIEKTNQKLNSLKRKMKGMEESGDVNSDGFRNAQADIEKLENKLKELKQQRKQVDEAFEHPVSPEGMAALKREIQDTKIQLENLEKTAGSASATLEKISQSTGNIGEKAQSMGQALMPVSTGVAAIGAASVVTANNFEDAMSQAAGALDKPITEMGELRKLAIQMGQDTIFSATEAGNAITELAKGGLTEAQIESGALKTAMDLAASSGMSLGDAANVVVQTMGAFGLEANQSAEAANALAGAAAASSTDVQPLTEALAQCSAGANNAGWSIQETTAVLGRFADAGINGSDAGTSLKTMLQRLSAPTDEAATMIENLGIQTRDSNGNLLGASEVAEELKNKLGGLDSATRDAALQTIFGSDAMRAAVILMNSGSEGLQKYEKAANDQEAAQRMANSQMGEGSRAIEELKGSLETAAIKIGDTLAPVIQKLAEFITDLVNKFTNLPEGIQTAIVVFGMVIAVLGPLLIVTGKVAAGISAVTGAFSALKTVKPIIALLKGVGLAFKGLWAIINMNPFTKVITIITVIIMVFKILYEKCDWFRDGVDTAVKAITGFFQNLGESAAELKNKAVDAFGNMVEGIRQKVSNIGRVVKEGFQTAIDFITSLPEQALEWGKDFVEGIADGIRGAIGKVTNAVKSVANKIKSFLHFSRPDEGPLREYETWMPDFIDGLVKGIDSNIYKVSNAMKRAAGIMKQGTVKGMESMSVPGRQEVVVNLHNTTQIGNREFDSYIVKTARKGIAGRQSNLNVCRGY